MALTKSPQTIEEMCLFLESKGRPALLKGALTLAPAAGVGEPHIDLLHALAKAKPGDLPAFKGEILKWCRANDGEDVAQRLAGGKDEKGEWDRHEERKPDKSIVERPVVSCHEAAVGFMRAAGIERSSDTMKGFHYALLAIAAETSRSRRKFVQEVASAAYRTVVAVERKPANELIQRVLGQLQAAAS